MQKKITGEFICPPVNVPHFVLFEVIMRVLRGSGLRGSLRIFGEILIDIFGHDELSEHHLPVAGKGADEFIDALLCGRAE